LQEFHQHDKQKLDKQGNLRSLDNCPDHTVRLA